MPRPTRLDLPDGVYHVTSRGNGKMRIFYTDDDRRRFLKQLQDNLQTAAVVLYAYVLMDNHFHLLARTPRANLSRFMQRLNTSYAMYASFKHGRPGHQFQGRFKAKIVQDDAYLTCLTRYIHLNPVKTAASARRSKAQRVRRLETYPWSSYPGFVAESRAEEFVCYDVLKEFGPSPSAARRHYRAYVHACVLEDDAPLREAMKLSRYAIGDGSFVEKTESELANRRQDTARDRDLALPAVTVDIDVIDAAVARHYRIPSGELKTHGRHSGVAKYVAVELACRLTGLNHRAVGDHYGGMTGAAVGSIRKRIRRPQHELAEVIAQLADEIQRQAGSDLKFQL